MTGMIVPFCVLVASLNQRTNSPRFTPCWPSAGPTGGAGVACPPGSCSFTLAVSSLAMSDRLHLPVLELDRGRPAEDRHDHLHEPLLGVHFLDRALEVEERPVLDPDVGPLLELDPELRLVGRPLHVGEDPVHVLALHRDGRPARPD